MRMIRLIIHDYSTFSELSQEMKHYLQLDSVCFYLIEKILVSAPVNLMAHLISLIYHSCIGCSWVNTYSRVGAFHKITHFI